MQISVQFLLLLLLTSPDHNCCEKKNGRNASCINYNVYILRQSTIWTCINFLVKNLHSKIVSPMADVSSSECSRVCTMYQTLYQSSLKCK